MTLRKLIVDGLEVECTDAGAAAITKLQKTIADMAAEKKAAQLPAKLTVPMIVFFLPVLFVVILGPAILTVIDMMAAKGAPG